jgi:hypothetical protein
VEGESAKYRVHLVDEATVVARGERVRVWFLPLNDGWVRAKDHPDAEIEEAKAERRDKSCPPGTIWRREIELMLPRGCPLLSRVTSPLIEALGTMDYLTRERKGMRRHTEETWMTVVGNYRLKKSEEPQSFSRARKAHHASDRPR